LKIFNHIHIGILHSLIGKNDGVSIVIDQTANAMITDMKISLGNIHFLAAHSSPRFNTWTDEIFWHKNDILNKIIKYFSKTSPIELDNQIHEHAMHAKNVIKNFIEHNEIDLLIH